MKKSKNKFQNMKKGYLIVRINIKNAELFQQYPPLSTKAVEKFGGKYLIRGGTFDVVEGEWPAERTTVVEFESFSIEKPASGDEDLQCKVLLRNIDDNILE